MTFSTQSVARNIMLTVLCVLPPGYAFALDFTPDASRVVSDPTYLPMRGQVYGETSYEYLQIREDEDFNAGGRNALTHHSQYVNQSLAYGITDDITISAAESYVTQSKKSYSDGATYRFDGFEDPDFTATWRVLDQKNYPVNVDIIASYAPDAFNNRNSTATSTGSVARGGSEAGGGLAVGYKTHSFTIEGVGGADYYGNTSYYSPSANADGHTDSYWGYYGGIQTQLRLTDILSFNAGYRYSTYGSDNTTETSGTTYKTSFGDTNSFNAALNYHIIPNRLVAGLYYDYQLYGVGKITYADLPADFAIKNNNENIFEVRLQYVFF